MKNAEVVCDACEARMRLSEGLLSRIAGKTGRITCKQCDNKIALDAKGAVLRVTQGGSLLDLDLEVLELEEAPRSGLDLIDPAFSEFPAEIKMKEAELPVQNSNPADDSEAISLEAARPSGSSATSIPPPLPSDLQEKRRRSIAAQMEAPVPEGVRRDEDSLTPHSLGEDDDLPELEHAPPSSPFASERDETFRSLYAAKEPEPALAPAFSSTPAPPHKSGRRALDAPLTPGAVVLGSDGKLHNRAEFGSGAGGSTWLPWTVAAVSLLALGISLTAQVSGDFRQTLTSRSDDPDSSMTNYGVIEPVEFHAGEPKEPNGSLAQDEISEEVLPSVKEPRSMLTPSSSQTKEALTSGAAAQPVKTVAPKKSSRSDAPEPSPSESPEQDKTPQGTEEETPQEVLEPLFNQAAASTSLAEASALAQSCRRSGDPAGQATVVVTFAASGRVTRTLVTGLHFAGTPLGGCIAGRFRTATVPAFTGDPVTLTHEVSIQ